MGISRVERKGRKGALNEGGGGILDGDIFSLREAVVEGGDVAASIECEADECETGVRERVCGVSERKTQQERERI